PVGTVTTNKRRLAVVAVGAALLLWLGPSLLGFAVTPIAQVVSALAGLLTGAALGTRITRAAHPSPQQQAQNRRKATAHRE
ncbi:MAG TPA: hypothetical protein VFO52_05530, partial [Longimicrobiales bacterium]|nr:hypothetical protein [Longimicrobiales bacterium]